MIWTKQSFSSIFIEVTHIQFYLDRSYMMRVASWCCKLISIFDLYSCLGICCISAAFVYKRIISAKKHDKDKFVNHLVSSATSNTINVHFVSKCQQTKQFDSIDSTFEVILFDYYDFQIIKGQSTFRRNRNVKSLLTIDIVQFKLSRLFAVRWYIYSFTC